MDVQLQKDNYDLPVHYAPLRRRGVDVKIGEAMENKERPALHLTNVDPKARRRRQSRPRPENKCPRCDTKKPPEVKNFRDAPTCPECGYQHNQDRSNEAIVEKRKLQVSLRSKKRFERP